MSLVQASITNYEPKLKQIIIMKSNKTNSAEKTSNYSSTKIKPKKCKRSSNNIKRGLNINKT
jgi:hypothetical protein